MSLYQDQDQRSPGRLPGDGASCAPPPARGRRAGGVAGDYVRVAGPVILAAGYGLEQAVAARTGRRVLR